MASRRVLTGETIVVDGLRELQKELAQASPAVAKELKQALKKAGQIIVGTAGQNVSHKTGRKGNDGPPLAQTIKTSATQTGLSVWSAAPHALVQDQGGQVGRHHATLLKRGEVSAYMSRAAITDAPEVEDLILDAVDQGTSGLGG